MADTKTHKLLSSAVILDPGSWQVQPSLTHQKVVAYALVGEYTPPPPTYNIAASAQGGATLTATPTLILNADNDPTLIGFWPLDNGEAKDYSGRARHGVVSGATQTTGKIGDALLFDGVDDIVTVPHDSGMTFAATDSFTLSAWVNGPAGTVSALTGVVTKSRDAAPYWGIWITDYNKWTFGGTTDIDGSLYSDDWHQVTIVQEGGVGRVIYVDGVSVGTGAHQDANGTGDLIFGGASSVSEFFAGSLDHIRLYNRALTAQQVSDLYNGDLGGIDISASLVGASTLSATAVAVGSALRRKTVVTFW